MKPMRSTKRRQLSRPAIDPELVAKQLIERGFYILGVLPAADVEEAIQPDQTTPATNTLH